MRHLQYFLDYVLSLLVVVPATLVAILFVPFRSAWYAKPARRDLMVFVAWPHASIEKQLLSGELGMRQFSRHPLVKTYFLCFGDFPKVVRRFKGNVIGIQAPLIAFPSVARYLPITEISLREVAALVMVMRFCIRYRPAFLDNTSPLFDMWRLTMLKWLLPVTVTTQVAGNLDLIYTNFLHAPARGLSFRQIYSLAWMLRIKCMAQLFYRSVDLAIGYNINNQNSAISNGAHPDKTAMVRIRINSEALSSPLIPREKLPDFPETGRIISMWGRLSVGKYIWEAFSGCLPLLKTRNDIFLVIAGDGELGEVIRNEAKTQGVASQVCLLGRRDHGYIRSLAQYSDVVLAPYSGSSLVECAMLGRPCVAFNIEWHNELITDGETGWLVDYTRPSNIAAALEDAIDHPDVSCERARLLKIRAQKMFNEKNIEASFHEIYQRLLDERT